MIIIIAFLVSLAFGWLLFFIADKRGVNKIFWSVMGFMFWFFALPFIFFARRKQTVSQNTRLSA